LVDDAIETGDT